MRGGADLREEQRPGDGCERQSFTFVRLQCQRQDNSPISFPSLKTYNLHFLFGFFASGGSWYLRAVPLT